MAEVLELTDDRRSNTTTGHLILRWSAVAVGCAIVAVTCLGALVVVAAVQGADALSTVALALAVLAFVAQIVVFIAQAWTADRQLQRADAVHTQTQALLTQIQTSTQGTYGLLSDQFNTVLKHALEASLPKGADSAAIVRDVQRALDEGTRTVAHRSERRRPSRAELEQHEKLKSWPPAEEAQALVQVVKSLSLRATSRLGKFAQDYYDTTAPGSYGGVPGFFVDDEWRAEAEELMRAGLLHFDDPPERFASLASGRPYARLSSKGITAARFFTADGDPPAYWTASTDSPLDPNTVDDPPNDAQLTGR